MFAVLRGDAPGVPVAIRAGTPAGEREACEVSWFLARQTGAAYRVVEVRVVREIPAPDPKRPDDVGLTDAQKGLAESRAVA